MSQEKNIIDTFKHQGLRRRLVEMIRMKGINDLKVLEAISKVPRHLFMDNAFVHFAYEDKAFPIGSGQTISQPFTVAKQTELLEIRKYDKVLEQSRIKWCSSSASVTEFGN